MRYAIKHMPKSKKQKKDILEAIKDKISRSKSIVFTNFDKLEVKESEELRSKLKEENSEYYVAKKTLFEKAFEKENI